MTDGAFPTGWALMKPQQTIEPAEFERLWAQGLLIPTRKRDGNRAHIVTARENTRIYSRNGTLDWTSKVPHIVEAFAAPRMGIYTSTAKYPFAELHNHSGLLRDLNKMCGWNRAALRVTPTAQRFQRDHLAGCHFKERLVMKR